MVESTKVFNNHSNLYKGLDGVPECIGHQSKNSTILLTAL